MVDSAAPRTKLAKTKIVATIGPASNNEKIMTRLIQNGMTIARLNFSHGTYEDHFQAIKHIRKLSNHLNQPVAILQDLCGPKIRLASMKDPVELKRNSLVRLAVNKKDEAELYTDFKDLLDWVIPGNSILIDDCYIELRVKEINKFHVTCQVIVPGVAKSRKGINLPDIKNAMPVFTSKDRQDLCFGLDNDVDLIAMSFVDSGSNAQPLRDIIGQRNKSIPIIAKIERSLALKNIGEIIDNFDGIMLARGDLGVEIPPEQVPIIQKELLKKANLENKLTITATQMLESMIHNPRPTRAEASDVSNAIIDGSDAVMLSGETAVGKYPDRAVSMMRRIALVTENSSHFNFDLQLQRTNLTNTEAIVRSAVNIAREMKAKSILVFSFTGNTALKISKYRPPCPVYAFTSQKEILGRMAPMWGIIPHYVEFAKKTDEMISKGEEKIKERGMLKPGDMVVIVSGPTPLRGATNMLKLTRIP